MTPERLERPAPQACAAVSTLCEILPEVRGILSLLSGLPGVPPETRARCMLLYSRVQDAMSADAEAVRL